MTLARFARESHQRVSHFAGIGLLQVARDVTVIAMLLAAR